jgi:hypothetical protein
VVRNAATDLRRTLSSFENQAAGLQALPTELVLVDGASTDGSLQLAQHWAASAFLPTRLLQQPPQGIYAAMNLAWRQASGNWLLFINAGDLLLNALSLVNVLDAAERDNIDSVQAQAAIFAPGCRWACVPTRRSTPCHQSLLYRRCLHQSFGPYNERLGLCADTLLMQQFPKNRHREQTLLLAATQVSPRNASRHPERVRQDLQKLQYWQIALEPWPAPGRTLLLLQLEQFLGLSLSVWIKALVEVLNGSRRLIRLPDDRS